MTSWTVTENANKLYLGEQPQVTLVNDGPFTIYFDENASVDTLNGFELPPTGQMTWKPSRELWAKTRPINGQATKAVLKTNPAGELSLTTRAKFVRELYRADHSITQPSVTPFIEVGHCNTLFLKRSGNSASSSTTWLESVTLTWYDDNLNPISVNDITVASGDTTFTYGDQFNSWRLRIPVAGRYLKVVLVGDATGTFPVGTAPFVIYGTDIAQPISQLTTPNALGVTVAISYQEAILNIDAWNMTTGTIKIPSLDHTFRALISSNTGATSLGLFDRITSKLVDLVIVPVAPLMYTFVAPARRCYYLAHGGPGSTSTDIDIEITWPYYQ